MTRKPGDAMGVSTGRTKQGADAPLAPGEGMSLDAALARLGAEEAVAAPVPSADLMRRVLADAARPPAGGSPVAAPRSIPLRELGLAHRRPAARKRARLGFGGWAGIALAASLVAGVFAGFDAGERGVIGSEEIAAVFEGGLDGGVQVASLEDGLFGGDAPF